MKYTLTKDNYLKMYGGKAKLYNIYCANCGKKLFVYQKDGWKGPFKRCYFNRIRSEIPRIQENVSSGEFCCEFCKNIFGIRMYHKRTKREAIRLFVSELKRRAYKQ